jgi:hypothetical protein
MANQIPHLHHLPLIILKHVQQHRSMISSVLPSFHPGSLTCHPNHSFKTAHKRSNHHLNNRKRLISNRYRNKSLNNDDLTDDIGLIDEDDNHHEQQHPSVISCVLPSFHPDSLTSHPNHSLKTGHKRSNHHLNNPKRLTSNRHRNKPFNNDDLTDANDLIDVILMIGFFYI